MTLSKAELGMITNNAECHYAECCLYIVLGILLITMIVTVNLVLGMFVSVLNIQKRTETG